MNRSHEKGPVLILGYLFMVSQRNLSALEQSWLHDSQRCVAGQVCSCGRENRDFFERPFPLTQLMLPLSSVTYAHPFSYRSHLAVTSAQIGNPAKIVNLLRLKNLMHILTPK